MVFYYTGEKGVKMLNELCTLADSLQAAGIYPKEWHPLLKQLPNASKNKPCIKILINENCEVVNLLIVAEDLVPQLKKWEPNNGNSFPAFNIQPLYRIVEDTQKKILREWKDSKKPIDTNLLKNWCTKENSNWDFKLLQKLEKCLFEIPKKLLVPLECLDEDNSLKILISRLTVKSQINNFIQSYENLIWQKLKNNEFIKESLTMLIFEGTKDKDVSNDRGTLSVIIDISDDINIPVASLKTIELLNDCLISNNVFSEEKSINFDAYGYILLGGEDKLPGVKLPMLSEAKLRAMNSESSCQFRYGTIDANSFPIGYDSRKRAKGALEWLSDTTRECETWGRTDGSELLFAYPAILPKIPIKLAACFGAKKPEISEARFANAAKDVITALRGISNDLNNLELRVFSLKKMDKARTKVVFHRNYTAQRLIEAAKDWQDGADNVPEVTLCVWGESKGEILTLKTETPFPLQIANVLNRVWKIDGTSECTTQIVQYSQGIELLLDKYPERFVPYLLSVSLKNNLGALLFLGSKINKNEVIAIKGNDKQKLLMPAILGLLLHKLGIRKEIYMSNAPFLVGRMLKLADELHALYCKVVRDNNLPPQLIGNSLMTAALNSPSQALAQLALRLKPYYGWAQTYQGKENGGLAGYFLNLYSNVSLELAKEKLPVRFNDPERAQLLLGYLSANQKKSD